jgi:NAD(P)H-dependent flavin oxidoreductase YrpB (nitropropane dioxygenase family)
MLATRFTERLGVDHPIALGGMGTGTCAALVSAVCNAGGLGVLGKSTLTADGIRREVELIRQQTDRPFGVNFLLAFVDEERFAAGLEARPAVLSYAWPRPEQDLADYFARSHAVGATVMHMVSTAADGRHAADAGADIIVAQGTEGGGHVGQMASMVLIPQTVSAVPDRPVLAAGGVADGRGLAAALAFGADGVLLGTRFLATPEAPIPQGYKEAIVESDGTDSVLSDVADIISGRDWPGALNRVRRNRFLETWIGREYEVRRRRVELQAHLRRAWEAGDADQGSIGAGQVAGLIDGIAPAADLVRVIAAEAEQIIAGRLPALVRAERAAEATR